MLHTEYWFSVAEISYECHRRTFRQQSVQGHSIGNKRWHWQRIKCLSVLENPCVFVCVHMRVFHFLCLSNELLDHQTKKKHIHTQGRSQTHFTSNYPFTHLGCWHVTQLVTAWITLYKGLRERITVEIQFCVTSNVRVDPSDPLWYPQRQQEEKLRVHTMEGEEEEGEEEGE